VKPTVITEINCILFFLRSNYMAENSSSGAFSMASAPARSDDPAWAHGQVVVGAKNSSICVHCSKRINGSDQSYNNTT